MGIPVDSPASPVPTQHPVPQNPMICLLKWPQLARRTPSPLRISSVPYLRAMPCCCTACGQLSSQNILYPLNSWNPWLSLIYQGISVAMLDCRILLFQVPVFNCQVGWPKNKPSDKASEPKHRRQWLALCLHHEVSVSIIWRSIGHGLRITTPPGPSRTGSITRIWTL